MVSSKSQDKKIMDVSKPGKSSPDISARPVVITHHPMVQDPMVKENEKPENNKAVIAEESKQEPAMHSEKIIKPVSEDVDAEQPSVDEVTRDDDAKSTAQTSEKEDLETEETKQEPKQEAEQAEQSAVVDAVTDQATIDRKNKNKLSDAEKAKQEQVQKLIAEKKYFVPKAQVSHRRNQRTTIILVMLIVIVAGVYLAMDAGVLDVGFDVPYDLIQN